MHCSGGIPYIFLILKSNFLLTPEFWVTLKYDCMCQIRVQYFSFIVVGRFRVEPPACYSVYRKQNSQVSNSLSTINSGTNNNAHLGTLRLLIYSYTYIAASGEKGGALRKLSLIVYCLIYFALSLNSSKYSMKYMILTYG